MSLVCEVGIGVPTTASMTEASLGCGPGGTVNALSTWEVAIGFYNRRRNS